MLAASGTQGFKFLDNYVTIPVAGADNEDRISIVDMRMPYGEAPPLHVHHAEDEIFHILDGEMRFEIGGQSVTKRAGDTVLAPRGVPHGFRVTSEDGVRALIITRGGFEAMLRSVASPAATAEIPTASGVPSPEMQASLARHCAAQRIDLIGPPIA